MIQSFSSTIGTLNTEYQTKEEAIQTAYDARSDEWKNEVISIVHGIAQNQSFLSADDVVRRIEACENLERSYVALPAIFKIAKVNGWIEEAKCTCGEELKTCESQRLSNHGRRILIYRSMCYNTPYVFDRTHEGVREGNHPGEPA